MISETLKKAREYEKREQSKIPEAERPAYHFSVPVGWMNDPNGFSGYQGEYHLFYQYHPYGTDWNSMHWGHAKTRDFVAWEYLPAALAPDKPYDAAGVFSGGAVEKDGRQALLYTGVSEEVLPDGSKQVRQNQCLAVGDGLDYEKDGANPVITADQLPPGSSLEDFRDPKVWKEDETFYTVVGSRAEDGSGQVALFSSEDLKHWKFCSILDRCENRYGKMWECPDFFRLGNSQILMVSPQDMMAEGLEFHNGNGVVYLIGDYEKEQFRFHRKAVQSPDYGLDFYAAQTLETSDGRRILIGWMKSWDANLFPEGFRWNGMMTVPRELSLKNGRIYATPVRELERYRRNEVSYRDLALSGNMELPGLRGRTADITVELKEGSYECFRMLVAQNQRFRSEIIYDPKKGILTFDRTYSGLRRDFACRRSMAVKARDGRVSLRILLDRYSVEIFVNGGESVLTAIIPTPQEADGILFEVQGKVKADIVKYELAQ